MTRHRFALQSFIQLWTGRTIPLNSVVSSRFFTIIVPCGLSTPLCSVGVNSTPVEMDNCIGQNLSHADTPAESDTLNRLRAIPFLADSNRRISPLPPHQVYCVS